MLKNIKRAAAVGAILALPACTTSGSDPSVDAFAQLFAGYSADYEPASNPADLAERADVVVVGTIAEVTTGRTWYPGQHDESETITVVVAVDSVNDGELPAGHDGHLYLELDAPFATPAEEYDEAVPKDSRVVVYASRFDDNLLERDEVEDVTAGRPVGQSLFQITTPQGFVIEEAGVKVVQVIDYEDFTGADISDYLPSSENFPVSDHDHMTVEDSE